MKTIGIFIVTFIIFSLFSPVKVFAGDLLKNGDFETGSISHWEAGGGGVTAEISTDIRYDYTGEYALKIINDKTIPYGYWQTLLDIEGGKNYWVTGFSASSDINIAYHYMQIAWYESIDASGSPISTIDSIKGENDPEWAEFDFVTQAPENARSVKVGLVLNSKTEGVPTYAVFDNIAFEEYVAPTPTPTGETQPTNTPALIVTSTPVPTPTSIPTSATPTPTKRPTPTLALTPTPISTDSGEIFLETSILPTPTGNDNQGEILGVSTGNTGNNFKLPIIFISTGLSLMLVSLGILILPKIKSNLISKTMNS
jgi:hypothetical protein